MSRLDPAAWFFAATRLQGPWLGPGCRPPDHRCLASQEPSLGQSNRGWRRWLCWIWTELCWRTSPCWWGLALVALQRGNSESLCTFQHCHPTLSPIPTLEICNSIVSRNLRYSAYLVESFYLFDEIASNHLCSNFRNGVYLGNPLTNTSASSSAVWSLFTVSMVSLTISFCMFIRWSGYS